MTLSANVHGGGLRRSPCHYSLRVRFWAPSRYGAHVSEPSRKCMQTPEHVCIRAALVLQCAFCTAVHCILMLSPPDLCSQHLNGYHVGMFTYIGRHSSTMHVPRIFVRFIPSPSLMNVLERAPVCLLFSACFQSFCSNHSPRAPRPLASIQSVQSVTRISTDSPTLFIARPWELAARQMTLASTWQDPHHS